MTKRTNLVWLLAVLWLVLGCKDNIKSPNHFDGTPDTPKFVEPTPSKLPQSVSDIYIEAATETCRCMQPMIEKAKYLKYLQDTKQLTDMKRVAEEMAQLEPQIQKCSEDISRKYSQINNHQEKQRVFKILLVQCPDIELLFSS